MGFCKLSYVGGLFVVILGLFLVKEGKEEVGNIFIWGMNVKKNLSIYLFL